MRREILFRGKCLMSNDWIYGDLLQHDPIPCIKSISHDSDCNELEVDKDTVGQYTGLKDKNGVKIFEHDLLEDNYFCDEGIEIEGFAEVVFDVKKAEWAVDNSFKQDKSSFTSLVTYFGDELKVIGNIHDNEK